MARSIGSLTLDLIAKTGSFDQGMDRASRRVRNTANEMEAARRAADRMVAGIAAAAAGFATAAAAMAVSSAKALDATSKMAQQIGTTTESLTGMRFAAQQFANISDQQFDMSMRRMTRRIAEAAEGSGSAKKALEAMGLSARELARLSPDKQMLAIADAMQRTESQADRLRYTMALFDTEGMALVPALQQGAEAFEANIALARQFGVVVSQEAASAAEEFMTNMNLLTEAQKGFKNQVAESVLPVLAEFSGYLVDIAKNAGDMGERVETALKVIGVAAAATATIITSRLVASILAKVGAWGAATLAAARLQAQMTSLSAAIAGASRVVSASAGLAAGAATALGRAGQLALGVLGGPVGLAAAAAITGAAFLAMGRDSRTAATDVDELTRSLENLNRRQLESAAFNLENELGDLSKQAEEHGQILRTLNADYEEMTKRYGENYDGLRNVRQAIRDEEEALESVIATIAKKSPLLAQITQRLWDMDAASRGAAGGVETLNQAMGFSDADQKFLAQIQGRIKALQDAGDPIKIVNRIIEENKDITEAGKVALISAAHAEKALLEARAASARTTRESTKTLTEAQRAAQNFRREQEQSLRAQLQSVSAIHSQAQALEDQIAVYGLGKTALEDLTIARLEEQATILRGFEGSEEAVEAIEREIEARQRLRTAIGSMEQKEAERQAWEDWSRDVEQIFDRVGQSLTDAIFDGGKSGRDLLRDMFKGLTFNVLINPIMNQMQGWVTNQLGGMFGVQQPGGAGGMLGTAQNLYSGYNAITGGLNSTLGNAAQWLGQKVGSEALTSFGLGLSGTTAATGIASIGAGLGASLGTTIGTSAAAMASTSFAASMTGGALIPGLGVGAAGGGVGAGIGAAAGSAAAGGAAGIGSAVGAALPWIGGALAIGSAFGLFGGREPTTRRGQSAIAELRDGQLAGTRYDDRQGAAATDAVRQIADAAFQSTQDIFRAAGISAVFDEFYALTSSSYKGDQQGVASGGRLRIDGGEEIQIGLPWASDMTKYGVGGWSEADMMPRLAADVQITMLEALQHAGLFRDLLSDVDIRGLGDAAVGLAEVVQARAQEIAGLQIAVESLPFANLRDLSFSAAEGLIRFSGGLENLDAGMTSYFQNFYSEAEQIEWMTDQMSASLAELGFTMPDLSLGADAAKASLRQFVEGLDVTQEAGAKAFAGVMNLAGSYAELAAASEEMANKAIEDARRAAEETQRIEDRIASERYSLETQLLQLQGDTITLRMRELDTIDAANRGLQQQIWTLQDAAAAQQAYENSINSVTNSLAGIRETVLLDQLGTDDARYDYFKAQADGLARLIPQLEDQDALTRAMNQINTLTTRAYGTLDKDQKVEMGPEFLSYINRTEDLALQRMQAINESNRQASKEQARENAEAVSEAVGREVGRIADAIIRSVEGMPAETANAIRNAVAQNTGHRTTPYAEVRNKAEVNT